MKVWAISDLHMLGNDPSKNMEVFGGEWDNYLEKIFSDWNKNVKEDDIVIVAGDISWALTLEDAKDDLLKINEMPGKKIIIRGNHDYWWKSISAVRRILPNNMFALQNDAIKIGNYIFCGNKGYTVPETHFKDEHDQKLLDREVLRFDLSLSSANRIRTENDKVIAILHYPPFNAKIEDSQFTKLAEEYKVDALVYGHLHHKSLATLFVEKNGVEYFLTSCDKLKNKIKLIMEV